MHEIISFVRIAIDNLYLIDKELITRKVHERTIVYQFARHLEEQLIKTEYNVLNIDPEYNKNKDKPKYLPNFPKGTEPDILVHHRGYNDSNILVMEFKTWWYKDTSDDIEKLKGFTDLDGEYQYEIGISIVLGKQQPTGKIIEKGKVVGDF